MVPVCICMYHRAPGRGSKESEPPNFSQCSSASDTLLVLQGICKPQQMQGCLLLSPVCVWVRTLLAVQSEVKATGSLCLLWMGSNTHPRTEPPVLLHSKVLPPNTALAPRTRQLQSSASIPPYLFQVSESKCRQGSGILAKHSHLSTALEPCSQGTEASQLF